MNKNLLLVTLFFWIMASSSAQASKEPRPILSDGRIRQVVYDPNQVVDIVAAYGYVTTIEFAPDELVKGRTFGDSIAWQTMVKDNHLYIKPVEPDASGNMTVVTNKRSYFFKLDSSKSEVVFLVRFKYPAWLVDGDATTPAPATHRSSTVAKDFSPTQINLNYGSAGDKSAIQITRVFDDGQFTYFQFAPHAEIPAFYFVESNGTESNVNIHREGDYMVVERVGHLFTLRNGNAHLCIENMDLNNGSS